jgi:predicted DNA-binding transcriptional regulator AlpA
VRKRSDKNKLRKDQDMTSAAMLTSPVEKVTYSSSEVAALIGISRSAFDKHVASGRFPRPFYVGRLPRWLRSTVDEFLAAEQAKAALAS